MKGSEGQIRDARFGIRDSGCDKTETGSDEQNSYYKSVVFSKRSAVIVSFGLIKQFLRDFDRLAIPKTASQLSFSALFALIPLFALSVQVLLWLPGSVMAADELMRWLLAQVLPAGMSQWADQLAVWLEALQKLSVTGILISAVSSLFLVLRLHESLSEIWETPVKPLRFFALWFSTLLIPVAMGLFLTLFALAKSVSVFPSLFAGWIDELSSFIDFGPVISGITLTLCLTFLLRFIPGVRVGLPKLLLVAGLGAFVMIASGRLFMLILEQMPSLQLMTGLMSTMPLLLLWVYWISLVVLTSALVLKYWQNGPLKPLHLLSWDQLIRLVRGLHRGDLSEEKMRQKLGISHAVWVATLAELQRLQWVSTDSQGRFSLTDFALTQSFDQIWSLVSYRMPKEGDALHRLMGPLAKLPMSRVLNRMERQ